MKRLFFVSLFIMCLLTLKAAAQPTEDPFTKAQQAWNQKDYPTFLHQMSLVVADVGDQPALLLHMAKAYALTGDTAASFKILRQLAAMQLPYRLSKDSAFAAVRNTSAFREITAAFARYGLPTLRSQAGFIIRDKTLIPEGIAYDPVTRQFFVGSLAQRKIVQISPKGQVSNFTDPGQDSLWAVLGMRVDAPRRILWVCSANFRSGESGLFKYDLKTGGLLRKYLLDNQSGRHLLNDLAVLENGEVYLTDSEGGTVYTLDPLIDKLTVLNPQIRLIYPNGITHAKGQPVLYVAHFGGISVINLLSKEMQLFSGPSQIPLFGIDGLYFHENTLIGVQNGIEADRIMQFTLSKDGKEVVAAKVLESNHPQFKIPTTGVMVGKSFFYIANSQLRSLQPNGTLADPKSLKEVLILQIKL